MNHATKSAVQAVAAFINGRIRDIPERECSTNCCNGKPRDEFAFPYPNNVFTCWDARAMFGEDMILDKKDSVELANDTFKNVTCSECRVLLDAALEGRLLK